MALKLRVISDHYKQLGKATSRMFGVHGGRIGRAPDNDWVLPDPERYVSSHHAAIHFRGGGWILEDTSTNGVFVNEGNTPLSVSGPYVMKDGDRLRFGDYEFIVAIDDRNDFSADASGQMPQPPGLRRRATPQKRAVGQSHSESRYGSESGSDLGADLDISDLLAGGGDDSESGELGIEPLPGYSVEESPLTSPVTSPLKSQATARGFDAKPSSKNKSGSKSQQAQSPTMGKKNGPTSLLDDFLTESLPSGDGPGRLSQGSPSEDWHMSTRRLAKREPTAPTSSPVASPLQTQTPMRVEVERPRRTTLQTGESLNDDSGGAVDAFCRGAGIDAAAIPTDAHSVLLTLAGQMLREVVLSLMESLKNRADQKDRFRLSKTGIQPNHNNPLKFSASVEEALRKLLDANNTRYLGPVESLRDAFGDLKHHQLAVDTAMQAALDDLLYRLEPGELQERFDRGLKRGPLLGVTNKTKYWDLYTEFYPLLNQRDARGLPAVFTEEFTRIYGEKIAELENSKKK